MLMGKETMTGKTSDLSVAIAHDWMPGLAGGERVVQEMVRTFPRSEIYTLFDFLSDQEREELSQGRPIHVSRLNDLPGVRKYYRYLILSSARAIETFDVTHFDAVLSSSAAVAKGVLTAPDQKHFAYIHSPPRYAWDLTHEYIKNIDGYFSYLKRIIAHRMMHKFRIWDMRTIASVDHFIANSDFIRRRVWKTYRREANVIYPPVNTDNFVLGRAPREGHYVTASRLVPYKCIPMIAAAFAMRPNLKLRVVGDGPEMSALRSVAGPNVEILGHLPFEEMKVELQTARAFVFAAKEDFGIVPVEAQACGTPVIALGQGGATETVRPLGLDNPTGVWFAQQTPQSLVAALDEFESEGHNILSQDCRRNSLKFSASRFRSEISEFVTAHLNN